MEIESSSITIPNNIISQELDGEAILLDIKNERYYSLKESGCRMWQLMHEYGEISKVEKKLLEEYSIDEETISRDLYHLIGWLVERGLIHVGQS